MSPSTQVSLIALVLFFVVAGVSIVWPHLAGLDRSRMRSASEGLVDRTNARTRTLHEHPLAKALREAETKNWGDLPPQIRTRALYLGAAALLITVIVVGVQFYYATPPQLVQRTPQ
jgi:hypothetical protein